MLLQHPLHVVKELLIVRLVDVALIQLYLEWVLVWLELPHRFELPWLPLGLKPALHRLELDTLGDWLELCLLRLKGCCECVLLLLHWLEPCGLELSLLLALGLLGFELEARKLGLLELVLALGAVHRERRRDWLELLLALHRVLGVETEACLLLLPCLTHWLALHVGLERGRALALVGRSECDLAEGLLLRAVGVLLRLEVGLEVSIEAAGLRLVEVWHCARKGTSHLELAWLVEVQLLGWWHIALRKRCLSPFE